MSTNKPIFSKNHSDFSFEEIKNILKENNLTNHKHYLKFCAKHKGKIDGKQMPKKPWLLSEQEISCVSFFNDLFPNRNKSAYVKKVRLNMEEHFQLIRENNLYTIKKYQEFFNENKNKIKGLFANPWAKYNMPAWDFLDMAIPDRAKVKKDFKEYEMTTDEILELMKKHNLNSSRTHRKFYLQNRNELSLPSRPWDRFGMKEAEFFNTYFPERIKISSLEEIKKVFLENKITSAKLYKQYIQDNPNHGINLNFHKINKIKFSEFLDYVWGKERIKEKQVISLDDFLNLIREAKIFSINQYKKFYKENKSVHPYIPGNPMVSYKLSQPELFKLAFPICNKFPKGRIHYKTKREDVILFLSENNVQDIFQYKEIEKELPLLKDILKVNDHNINNILKEVAEVKKA